MSERRLSSCAPLQRTGEMDLMAALHHRLEAGIDDKIAAAVGRIGQPRRQPEDLHGAGTCGMPGPLASTNSSAAAKRCCQEFSAANCSAARKCVLRIAT